MKERNYKQSIIFSLFSTPGILIIMLTSSISFLHSQNKIEFGMHQDLRLAVSEDATGNYKPFTLDFLFKFKMEGHESKNGYLTISPMFEYAELESIYKRFAVDVGFTFNNLVLRDLEFTPSVNWGILDHFGASFLVFGFDFELSYKINDFFKISGLIQSVDRKDLMYRYGTKTGFTENIKFSGFIGVVISPFQ